MPQSRKIAISLPGELMKKVEKQRKKTGESRSAFIRRALEARFERSERDALEERYVRGYLEHPETAEEVAEVEAMAAEVFDRESW